MSANPILRRRLPAALLLLLLLLLLPRSAAAHDRVELEEYAIIVGWEMEPVIVGERNAIFLEISRDGEPVTGAEGGLDAEVRYGGATFRANLNPAPEEGIYLIPIFPTVRGQYELRLFGTLGDLEVDTVVEPEEVLSAAQLQFPEVAPDARALQTDLEAQIGELESALATARLVAFIGLGVALLATFIAAAALLRRRS